MSKSLKASKQKREWSEAQKKNMTLYSITLQSNWDYHMIKIHISTFIKKKYTST